MRGSVCTALFHPIPQQLSLHIARTQGSKGIRQCLINSCKPQLQNYPVCKLQLVVETIRHSTNQNSIKVQLFSETSIKTLVILIK